MYFVIGANPGLNAAHFVGMKSVITLVICILLLQLGGCATNPHAKKSELQVENGVIEAAGKFHKEYVLIPGDKIEVSVWRVPEVSRIVVVRPDGYISLPTLQSVKAAGLTFPELEQKLTELFSKRLSNPNVTVIASEVRQSVVYVMGDVTNQSPIPLHRATTALQAVANAGGFRRSGAAKDVSIIRLGSDGVLRAIPVDIKASGQADPYMALSITMLQPDDIVFVPETRRSEIVRFMDDFIGRPLGYVNMIGNTYLTYRVIHNNNL